MAEIETKINVDLILEEYGRFYENSGQGMDRLKRALMVPATTLENYATRINTKDDIYKMATEEWEDVLQPFRIQFEGMDEEGVSIGAYALFKSEVEDTYIENGYLLMKEGRAFTFANPLCADVDLLGQFEVIDVQTKDFLSAESQDDFPAADFQGWNVLRVSADGQSVSTEGIVGNENYDMGCAFVGTSVPWFDEEGLPNYDVDEELLPEWVEGLQVDTTYYNSDGLSGYNLVIPVCKPLPEGVTGRSCKLDIFGNAGIAGNNQIIILQGDATLADGIAEVKADKKVIRKRGLYNLNGQSISTPVDGQLYIRDGKKYLNRKK